MNRNKAEELLVDMLAGELSPLELDQLELYETTHPEFSEYREKVECIWGMEVGNARSNMVGKVTIKRMIEEVIDKPSSKSKRIKLMDLSSIAAAGAKNMHGDRDNIKH